MKRFLLVISLLVWGSFLWAQTETDTLSRKKSRNTSQLSGRAADHFMIQVGYNGWAGSPDSFRTGGLSRTFNMYFMFDFPFKSDPRFSAAIGAGLGTDNMFFKQTTVDLRKYPLSFAHDTVSSYKKYKIATGYLEVPVELRFASNPANYNKAFKVALGVKVGTMIDAHTKAKITRDTEGYGGYTRKIKDKRNFNTTRLAGTLRVGYGVFSVFGTYQFNEFIREGAGPNVKPYSIGLTISGL
ncbi:outer membrane beta-barrel protein [Agriterribacter sp.]|uniref:outer membrane beta-barrel protein n=1 Tax=Agriterribacter sp. TaxID=2821509 RepID=UPI002BB69487|nr:outer membrane beta-barrel protein [Agriterribacter sp.]HRN57823.1 outer membrane beta-barrel protein [Agriterribacter sp.]HRO47818.1 outer membrane beta-barrel protein [Agriterribacter sp.]HRQ15875.1 outer membrane beta-barrel protein [Agriterribacter sp.]